MLNLTFFPLFLSHFYINFRSQLLWFFFIAVRCSNKFTISLQSLAHYSDSFSRYTHVILDEIHERDMESDLLSMIVKMLAEKNPEVKIIAMSATLQADMFMRYAKNDSFQLFLTFLQNLCFLIFFSIPKNNFLNK